MIYQSKYLALRPEMRMPRGRYSSECATVYWLKCCELAAFGKGKTKVKWFTLLADVPDV